MLPIRKVQSQSQESPPFPAEKNVERTMGVLGGRGVLGGLGQATGCFFIDVDSLWFDHL